MVSLTSRHGNYNCCMSIHLQLIQTPPLFSYTNPAKLLNYKIIEMDENREMQSCISNLLAQLPLILGNWIKSTHSLFKLHLESSWAFSFLLLLWESCLKISLPTKVKKKNKKFHFSLYSFKAGWLFRRDVNSHISGQSFSVTEILPLWGFSHLLQVSLAPITEESKHQTARLLIWINKSEDGWIYLCHLQPGLRPELHSQQYSFTAVMSKEVNDAG